MIARSFANKGQLWFTILPPPFIDSEYLSGHANSLGRNANKVPTKNESHKQHFGNFLM